MATSAGQGSDPTESNPSITMKQSGTEGVTTPDKMCLSITVSIVWINT